MIDDIQDIQDIQPILKTKGKLVFNVISLHTILSIRPCWRYSWTLDITQKCFHEITCNHAIVHAGGPGNLGISQIIFSKKWSETLEAKSLPLYPIIYFGNVYLENTASPDDSLDNIVAIAILWLTTGTFGSWNRSWRLAKAVSSCVEIMKSIGFQLIFDNSKPRYYDP